MSRTTNIEEMNVQQLQAFFKVVQNKLSQELSEKDRQEWENKRGYCVLRLE